MFSCRFVTDSTWRQNIYIHTHIQTFTFTFSLLTWKTDLLLVCNKLINYPKHMSNTRTENTGKRILLQHQRYIIDYTKYKNKYLIWINICLFFESIEWSYRQEDAEEIKIYNNLIFLSFIFNSLGKYIILFYCCSKKTRRSMFLPSNMWIQRLKFTVCSGQSQCNLWVWARISFG
jgi:hypothetical protein